MKIFSYYRSSAAYRLRIALNLKGLSPESTFIHLRRGEQNSPAYRQINPFGLVPALEHEGRTLYQTVAIMEYLEEIQPLPALLPRAPWDRAYVRSIAMSIACDIHPLNNLRVLKYLKETLAVESAQHDRWYAHWIKVGFSGLEALLSQEARVGNFCFADAPTMADVCLVPQVYNAERMNCDLDPYPTLRRVTANARAHVAFREAEPDRQSDAEK